MIARAWFRIGPAGRRLLLGLILVTLAARAADEPLQEVPKDRALELRVLYLEDPRLPTLDAAQRRALCDKIELLLQTWFGYRARLREVGRKDLADYFTRHAQDFRKHPEILRMQLDPDKEGDRQRIRTIIKTEFSAHSLTTLEGHLSAGKLLSPEHAVEWAYDHFLRQLREIRGIALPNGGTFADPRRPELNSYMHWCVLMHEMAEADVVFTNSMIVGADAQMPLSVISRGGVTTGNANANRHNSFGSAAVVGLFPFLSDAPFWMRERGSIPNEERLDVMATLAMHELGHMLLRQAHPKDHPQSCLFTPANKLRYYEWHRAIRQEGLCQLPHTKLTGY